MRVLTGGTDPMEKWQKIITETVLELGVRLKTAEEEIKLLKHQYETKIQ